MLRQLLIYFFSLQHVHVGLFLLRVTTGVIFMAHGAQKAFGWFDGRGFSTTVASFEERGITPALLMGILAVGTEFFGALFLTVGFLTRLSALLLVIFTIAAIKISHWEHGFYILNNGFEYLLALGVMSLTFLICGAGYFSIDRLIEKRLG